MVPHLDLQLHRADNYNWFFFLIHLLRSNDVPWTNDVPRLIPKRGPAYGFIVSSTEKKTYKFTFDSPSSTLFAFWIYCVRWKMTTMNHIKYQFDHRHCLPGAQVVLDVRLDMTQFLIFAPASKKKKTFPITKPKAAAGRCSPFGDDAWLKIFTLQPKLFADSKKLRRCHQNIWANHLAIFGGKQSSALRSLWAR